MCCRSGERRGIIAQRFQISCRLPQQHLKGSQSWHMAEAAAGSLGHCLEHTTYQPELHALPSCPPPPQPRHLWHTPRPPEPPVSRHASLPNILSMTSVWHWIFPWLVLFGCHGFNLCQLPVKINPSLAESKIQSYPLITLVPGSWFMQGFALCLTMNSSIYITSSCQSCTAESSVR